MNIWDDYGQLEHTAMIDDHRSVKKLVYFKGEGNPILLMHELPGLSDETFELAEKFCAEGFSVYLPLLLGEVGDKKLATGPIVGASLKICISNEFYALSANRTSPVTNWLRSFCTEIKNRHDAPGVGVIGMCLTGNFALTLMADDAVLGSISSQPGLPFFPGSGLHMSDDDVTATRERLDQLDHHMLGFRFEKDRICPKARFKAFNKAFNEPDRERIKLRTFPGTNKKVDHSVLVYDRDKPGGADALLEAIEYFKRTFAQATGS